MDRSVDKKINTENLKRISLLLKSIEHFIFFGTLLGYEREGEILEHDDDIDIYVEISNRKKVQEILTHTEFTVHHRMPRNRSPHFLQATRQVEDVASYIDFYFYENKPELPYVIERWNFAGRWQEPETNLHVPKNIIFPIKMGKLGEFDVNIPANPAGCCEYLYGSQWKVPLKKNSEYKTIIESNVPKVVLKNK